MNLRIVRSGAGHPTFNMGVDEALLYSVDAPPTLRLYRWEPHALSLGYFQCRSGFPSLPDELVVVRRLTGGGAILHGDELTFSLALDPKWLPDAIAASYEMLHAGVQRALDAVGVPTHPPTATATSAPRPTPTECWCFAAPTAQDLVTSGGGKILGSAQRRIRRPTPRVLHHGSLVLDAPEATPFCGSVAEFADPREVESELEEHVITQIANALGMSPREGDLTTDELARARELATSRYESAGFTDRR